MQRTAHTRHLAEQFGQDPCGTGRIPYRKYRLMRIDKVPGKRGERHQTGFKVIQQGKQKAFAPALNFAKRFYGRMDQDRIGGFQPECRKILLDARACVHVIMSFIVSLKMMGLFDKKIALSTIFVKLFFYLSRQKSGKMKE